MKIYEKGGDEMKNYESPEAKLVTVSACDVITSSIGKDSGENDGEWTAFVYDRPKSIGIWK